MDGCNKDLYYQIKLLSEILIKNEPLYEVIKKSADIGIKEYYIGAGCISQTVWNYQTGKNLYYGIEDVDFVYYDNSDLSYVAEDKIIKLVTAALKSCKFKLDIKNQARVHIWYKERFGRSIEPYSSVEEAIGTWPSTASAIGVRLENNVLKVFAPFGLNDLFGLILRANKVKITEETYILKTEKWKSKWAELNVIPWRGN